MYIFTMTDNKGTNITLPVVPEKYEIATENKNETVTLVDTGEINILKKPGLTEINFEVILPAFEFTHPRAKYPDGFERPDYFIDIFKKWRSEKTPVLFTIMRNSPNSQELENWKTTTMWTSIEEMPISEDWRATGLDAKIELKLKSWTKPAYAIYKVSDDGKTVSVVNTRKNNVVAKNTYALKEGETAAMASKAITGSAEDYAAIAEANPDVQTIWSGASEGDTLVIPQELRNAINGETQ